MGEAAAAVWLDRLLQGARVKAPCFYAVKNKEEPLAGGVGVAAKTHLLPALCLGLEREINLDD